MFQSMEQGNCGCGNAILENTGILNGGCGEGTIFTFTSGHKPKVDEANLKLVAAPNSNGGSHLEETLITPPEACLAPKRYHSRRSRSPCRIRIDFKDLLARNGTKGSKLRTTTGGQNGIDSRKLDWNDKAKQLAELFDNRKLANLGLRKTGKMHVVHGTVLPVQTVNPLSLEAHAVKEDQTDIRLSEMASKIREQEACRAALARENASLKEQLERIKSGEPSPYSGTAQGPAGKIAKDTMVLAPDKGHQPPNRSRIRKDKVGRDKGEGTDDCKDRLSIEKLLGERSNMVDKRRSMKAWLKSGYFDFSGTNRASPMARSFISFKAGLSSVGRKPYILRFKRRDKFGPKGGKVTSRNRKEDCNGHDYSTASEDLTAWTEAPSVTSQLRRLSSSLPEFSPKAVLTEPSSSREDKNTEDNFMQPEDYDKEAASGALQDVDHAPVKNLTDKTSLPQDVDEPSQQEKQVELQVEDQGNVGLGSDGGTKGEETSKGPSLQNRQELQISTWVSDVLAAVEAKAGRALDSLEDKISGEHDQSKLEAAGECAELETCSWHPEDLMVLEYEPVKENGTHVEAEFKVVETKTGIDDNRHLVQTTGIKAMLKDFHMKERLSRLRRMPVLFRPKSSSAYSWLRLSHENKTLMLQQVATNEVMKREIGLPLHKQGKALDLQINHMNFNGRILAAANDEDGSPPCIAQPLKDYQSANEIGQEEGITEAGHSEEEIIVRCLDNYSGPADSTLCVEDQETLEGGQLTCCSGFGPFGREKTIHSVDNEKQEHLQSVAKPATDPTSVTVETQDLTKSIFGRRKMRAMLNFRKDKEQKPVSHSYSYTSLSLIVGDEKKPSKTAKNKSAVKIQLKGYDFRQEAEGVLDSIVTAEDADSQHDSAQEDDDSLSNPGSRVEKCVVATEEPIESASSYEDARSARSLEDTQRDETRDSADFRTTCATEDYGTDKVVQVPKAIVPAEQVFLARFSTMSVDESRQSSSSSQTDPPSCRIPAESSSLSALTSLLLLNPPQGSTEGPKWAKPLSQPGQSAYSFGVRCGTAPSPSLLQDDRTLYEPFDISGRPNTASGNCSQDPRKISKNYNPPSHTCGSSFFHGIPKTETVNPPSHHPSGYHFCSQGISFPVCPSQSLTLENAAFPESCGSLLPRTPTHLPHLLAPHQPYLAHPWVCCNQQRGRPSAGSSHPLGHSSESLTEHWPNETSLNPDKDSTYGSPSKFSPSLHSQSPGPAHHLVHSKFVSSGMPFISQSRQGYDVDSITPKGVSRPPDYPPDINFQELTLPSVVPSIVPSHTSFTQPDSVKTLQPSFHDSAFPRNQSQVGHNTRSPPGQYHATHASGAAFEAIGLDIQCAPAAHLLHEPKEVLGIAPTPGSSTPQQMLWLSEEETEIIRQIRVSREKGSGPSPYSSSVFPEQGQSATNPKTDGPDTNEVIASYHRRTVSHCSNLSSISADDSMLPSDDGRSTKDGEANWKKVPEHDSMPAPSENKRQLAILEKQTKMVIAACRHSAAACIQKWWKRCLHQKALDLEQYHLLALKLSEMPGWLQQFSDVKLRSAAPISRVTQRRKWAQRRYNCLERAATTIQHWWRNLSARNEHLPTSSRKLPNTMKGFYNLVKSRHLCRGVIAPTHDRFVKLMERVQAATEGARVRRRLKSRRLQAMIMEIKEIRALLVEMSFDNLRDNPPNLIPQLYNQLQQKLLQLRTALTGPEKDARFVLRRSPASPLVIYATRPNQSVLPGGAGQKTGEQILLKSSTSSLAETLNAVNLHDKFNLISPPKRSHVVPSPILVPDQKSNRQLGRKFVDLAYAQIYQQKDGGFLPPSMKADEELQRFSQTESNMLQIQLQLQSSAGSEEQYYETEYVDQPDRPKRPYLKRKSIMMAPQKLDWSKVKPMVRSRLEPELRTKLIQNKSKGVNVSSTSRKVMKNYTKVKSRLFNYERKGSSFEASASSSKAAAGDADLSEFAEVRQWNEARKLERTQKALIKNFDITKKSNNRASESVPTGGKIRCKASDGPAPSRSDEGSQQKAEEKGGKSRQHSNRYGSTEDVSEKAKKESVGHHTASQEMGTPVSGPTPKQVGKGWVATVELEDMFKGVISFKNEKGISLNRLFQPTQDKTVVPQLNPSAHILNTSIDEGEAIECNQMGPQNVEVLKESIQIDSEVRHRCLEHHMLSPFLDLFQTHKQLIRMMRLQLGRDMNRQGRDLRSSESMRLLLITSCTRRLTPRGVGKKRTAERISGVVAQLFMHIQEV